MNPTTWYSTRIRIRENAKLVLEPNTTIAMGCYIAVGPGKTLRIGAETRIAHRAMINTICGLVIGKNVIIAHGVTIMDYDAHPIFSSSTEIINKNTYGGTAKPIVIEDNVFIGFNATILKGVTIGKGSVIAANSCVTKDVPSSTIVAGNPAVIIKKGIIWRRY